MVVHLPEAEFWCPNYKNSHLSKIKGARGQKRYFVTCDSIACARCFLNNDLAKFLAGRVSKSQFARASARPPSDDAPTCADRQQNTSHARDPPPDLPWPPPMVVGAVAPRTAPTEASARPPPQHYCRPQRRPTPVLFLARERLWRLISSRQWPTRRCAATRRLLRTVERRRSSPTRSSEGTDRKICALAARGSRAGRLGTTSGDMPGFRF